MFYRKNKHGAICYVQLRVSSAMSLTFDVYFIVMY